MRIGFGYDVHAFAENRRLILGGVDIPHSAGLMGHSDADVAVHAIMDALLGAAALGDIGKHFPDTDSKYKDADSLVMLQKINSVLKSNGFSVNNIDCTVAAQAPKLAPFIDRMRENISTALEVDISCISIKATTTEKLGFEGRSEGISAYAVCTINQC